MTTTVSIAVTARDTASSVLQKVAGELRRVDASSDQAAESLSRTARELTRASAAGSPLAAVFGTIQGQVAGLVAGFGAMQLGQLAVELSQLDTRAQAASRALAAVSGSAGAARSATQALREAVNFSVDTLTAQQIAASLLSREIVQSSSELRQFAADAALVGKAFGGFTAAEAINEVASAISNFSIERLDLLGISAAAVRERMRELETGTRGLSNEQAFAIAVQEELARSAQKLRDAGFEAGSGLEQLRAALRDVAVEAAGAGSAIDALAGSIARVLRTDSLEQRRQEIAIIRETAEQLERVGKIEEANALRRQAQALLPIQGGASIAEVQARTRAIIEAAGAEALWAQNVELARGRAAAANPELSAHARVAAVISSTARDAALAEEALTNATAALASGASGASLQNIINQLLAVRSAAGEATAEIDRMIAIASASIGALERVRAMGADGRFSPEARFARGGTRALEDAAAARRVRIESQIADTQRWFREWQTAHTAAARIATKAAGETQRAYEQALGSIRDAARGALSNLSESVNPRDALLDAFGLRRQGPSEIARRLEDVVVNAEKSPFAGAFKELAGKAGDELRATAEALKRDLQAGLRLDLIPDDLLESEIRTRLQAGEMMQARIESITQKLMSEGFEQDAIARALGGADVAGTLTAALTDTLASAGTGAGTTLVSDLLSSTQAALKANEQSIRQQGIVFSEVFRVGLADGMAGAGAWFVATLVDRVALEIVSRLNEQLAR